MKIYVASSLFNKEEASSIMDEFRARGVEITYDWTSHGQVFDVERLKEIAVLESQGVLDSDLLFFVHPGRHGAHVELGMAIAANKHIVMLFNQDYEMKPFYLLECIKPFEDRKEAIDFSVAVLKGDL
jgi:nucleoside 2-deoxyribosyltransferase